MKTYLQAGDRKEISLLAAQHEHFLKADPEVLENPGNFYNQVIEINLSQLEPQLSGPHSPDKVRPLKDVKEEIKKEGWPAKLSAALIGSCTNSFL